MAKELNWKSFETHEEQAAYVQKRFLELTPEERIKRFFEIWDLTRAFKSIKHRPEGFVLTRK